jgi:hypothetical protein
MSNTKIPKDLIQKAYKIFEVDKYPERKNSINEFIKTGNVEEKQENISKNVQKDKQILNSINSNTQYTKGSPEDKSCEIGRSNLKDSVQYNSHLLGVKDRIMEKSIDKPMSKEVEINKVSSPSKEGGRTR